MYIQEINIDDVDFAENDLKDYAKELLNADIRVFASADNKRITYLIISKNDDVGYLQMERFRGFSFSTKHKPNRKSGTGYQSEGEIVNPNIQNALMTFLYKPGWACHDGVSVEKYKDINDYLNSETVLRYIEVVL